MWITPPSIRSAFALELGCSTKELQPAFDTWVLNVATSSTLNGKHTHARSWKLAWKKGAWIQRLYGAAISENFQSQSFMDWWIASLRASRARTCPLLESAPGSTESAAACSSTSSTSPSAAVRGSSFWRTSQASLVPPPPLWTKPKGLSTSARPPASWENWPTAGGMRNGSLFQRPTWAPAMGASGGFAGRGENWTTPQAHDVTERGSGQQPTAAAGNACLARDARTWATPQARDAKSPDSAESGNFQRKVDQGYTIDLNSQAFNWPTPKGTDGTKGGPNQAGSKGDLMLPSAQWPTPSAAVMNDGESPATWHARAALLKEKHGNGNGAGLPLTVAAVQWPTPAARDSKGANSAEHALVTGGGRKHMDQLSNFVAHSSHLAQPMPDGQASCASGQTSHQPSASKSGMPPRLLSRRLNPAFVEILMGWPPGHTIAEPRACGPAEMASWRFALRQQLSCLFNE